MKEKKEMTTHTPTPLEEARSWLPLRAVHVEGTDGFHRLYSASGHFIASCVNGGEAAAFVALCNSHYALVAALEEGLRDIRKFGRVTNDTEERQRAALKAAKEGSFPTK